MPIDFQTWKSHVAGTAHQTAFKGSQSIVLDGERLASGKHVGLSAWANTFNTAARQRLNRAAMESFRAALIDHFRDRPTIAQRAFDRVVGQTAVDAGKKLTLEMVRRTIDLAEGAYAAALLQPPETTGPRIGRGLMRMMSDQGAYNRCAAASEPFRHLKACYAQAFQTFTEQLSAFPLDLAASATLGRRLDAVEADIDRLAGALDALEQSGEAPEFAFGTLREEIQTMRELIQRKRQVIADASTRTLDPAAARTHIHTLLSACTEAVARETGHPAQAFTLADFGISPDELERVFEGDVNGRAVTLRDPARYFSLLERLSADNLASAVKRQVKAFNRAHPEAAVKTFFFEKHYRKLVAATHAEQLQKQPWATLHRELLTTFGHRPFAFTSTITPDKQLLTHLGQGAEANVRYPGAINGYPSLNATTPHAGNLAKSEATVDGRTVFSGMRHMVLSAYALSGAERQAASLNRAREMLTSAFFANQDRLEAQGNITALAQPIDGKAAFEVRLHLTSVSLLTPSNGLGQLAGHQEQAMLADQIAALKALVAAGQGEEGIRLEHNGQIYVLRPQVTCFNIPVNPAAKGIGSAALGSWRNSEAINQAGFEDLRARADAFIAQQRAQNTAQGTKRADLAERLLRQLSGLYQRADKRDMYAAPARIALLAYLMGDVPCWNCKSGKDRTGMMDVECKFLATLAELGAPIPEPGEALNAEERFLLKQVMVNSGNLEMQAYNTGLPGYKTYNVSSNVTRMGATPEDAVGQMQQGFAAYVKS